MFLGGKREKVNGFDYWKVLRGDNFISIGKIRERYREKELGFIEGV